MSELKMHVGEDFADLRRRTLDVVARAKAGEDVRENHLSFASWEALVSLMTPKRLELLRVVHHEPQANVAALTRTLGRDYKRVYEDVRTLVHAGLIEQDGTGLRAKYDRIEAAITF